MKKIAKIFVVIIVVGFLGYLLYHVFVKIQHKNEVEKNLQNIPDFSFKTLENKNFTNNNLALNEYTIFIYFNTECNYCQYEAKSISENIASFKGTQLLFVSTEGTNVIKGFAKNYNLLNQPNITFLHDYTHTFSSRFDANSIPFLLVYNKNQALVKKHKGQLKVEAILKLIETR